MSDPTVRDLLDYLPVSWRDNSDLRRWLSIYSALMRDRGWPLDGGLADVLVTLSGGDPERAASIVRHSFIKGLYPFQVEAFEVYYADQDE